MTIQNRMTLHQAVKDACAALAVLLFTLGVPLGLMAVRLSWG